MEKKFNDIVELLPTIYKKVKASKELLLANLIMIGEIPAPTFEESERVACLQDRFLMADLNECSTDDEGNVFGILSTTANSKEKKKKDARNILLVAHTDTTVDFEIDHTIAVQPDRIIGAGIGDNALGLAALATLPMILKELNLNLSSNLIFMGECKSLGRGNIGGLKSFLENKKMSINKGICVEGLHLGRLAYSSTGMMRGEIKCEITDEFNWKKRGLSSAIIILNDIISKMLAIPLPSTPKTSIIYGSIRGGGRTYNHIALNSQLRFEVRSEDGEIVTNIKNKIQDIIEEVSSITGAKINIEFFAERHPGALEFSHPLVKSSWNIIKALDIKPQVDTSISELSVLLEKNIPAITIGLTKSEKRTDSQDSLKIDPIFTGITQLIGIILAIDNGLCDENRY